MTEVPPVAGLLDLSGRVAVVTGGSGGIGAGIARRFAEAGARVLLTYLHSPDAGARVASEIRATGGTAEAVRADLTEPEAGAEVVAEAVRSFGRLDALVNNAGIQPLGDVLTLDATDWDSMLRTNLLGAVSCTRAAARQLIEQGDGGAVVNVGSIEGSQPAFAHSHYAASKAALAMATRAAALELGGYGVRVNLVAPGLIDRPGLATDWPEGVRRWQAAAPLRRLGEPADVADACLFLASPAARWITGTTLTVDGGVLTHPTW